MFEGKAAYWKGENGILKGDINISDIENGQALVEVKYCGICGTDLAIFKGDHPRAKPPLIMGHEISGIIKKIKDVKLKEGDKVVVNPLISCGKCIPCKEGYPYICQNLKLIGIDANGGFSKYIIVDIDKLYKIPEDLDLKIASLVEPFAVGAHAFRIAEPRKEEVVVILGGGAIGLAVGLHFKYNGIDKVYFSEISEYRIDILKNFGFNVINPNKENILEKIKEISKGNLADIIIEATGSKEATFEMVSLAKVRGLIVLVGISHKNPIVDLVNVVFKELCLKGIRVYSDKDFLDSLNFVYKFRDFLKNYISGTYSLDKIKTALRKANNRDKSTKIVLKI